LNSFNKNILPLNHLVWLNFPSKETEQSYLCIRTFNMSLTINPCDKCYQKTSVVQGDRDQDKKPTHHPRALAIRNDATLHKFTPSGVPIYSLGLSDLEKTVVPIPDSSDLPKEEVPIYSTGTPEPERPSSWLGAANISALGTVESVDFRKDSSSTKWINISPISGDAQKESVERRVARQRTKLKCSLL
jgi:hypothetical protein